MLHDNIKNGILANTKTAFVGSNAPSYARPKRSKFASDTARYFEKFGVAASNVYDAQIQGLDYNDFYKWTDVKIRAAVLIEPTTGDELSSTWQKIVVLDKDINFIPNGAYVKFNGSNWIVFNADNNGKDIGTAVVAKCITTYNCYDYYGNVVRTPMYFAKASVLSSEPFYQEYMILPDGYNHMLIQLNETTKDIRNNTRMILGSSAFSISGLVDFATEFSEHDETIYLLRGDCRATETIPADDMEKHIAEGKNFKFTIAISGSTKVKTGSTTTLSVTATRKDEVITSTTEHPLTYEWESSDSTIATVNNGIVTGVAQGECTIGVTLLQNPDIKTTYAISVEQTIDESYVEFITDVPATMPAFEELVVEAKYFNNGVGTTDPITYEVVGCACSTEGNVLTIMSSSSGTKIHIKASAHGKTAERNISVEGL